MCKILAAHEVRPHKVRYYLERRDPEFEPKMAEVLCVYHDVEMRRVAGGAGEAAIAVVSARSVLRHIRVASKHELKQRIIEFIDDLNRDPVIHRWRYQIDAAV